jgi:leader peptidase (prepilin peptidase)/N-methyltransferase
MSSLAMLTAVAVVSASMLAAVTRPVLARLAEPLDGGDKTAYRDLGTPTFVVVCALLAALAQVVAQVSLPGPVLPLWTVLATVGVLLVGIDARTTWLPLPLIRAGWGLMALACVAYGALGGRAVDLGRTLLGAAIAGLLYVGFYLVLRKGIAFGDARFAPLLGAATASQSWGLLYWGLTLGTVVGAGHGIVRIARRRSGGFAYAPSMLAGCYLAALGLHLLHRGGVP